MFQHDAFLAAAHYFGEHEVPAPQEDPCNPDGEPGPEPPLQPSQGHETLQTSTRKLKDRPISEVVAMRLLQAQDFSHASCHQLLDTVNMTPLDRACLRSDN